MVCINNICCTFSGETTGIYCTVIKKLKISSGDVSYPYGSEMVDGEEEKEKPTIWSGAFRRDQYSTKGIFSPIARASNIAQEQIRLVRQVESDGY